MTDFKTLHPDIYYSCSLSSTKYYRRYDEKGKLLEAWDKKDDNWINVTEREQERIKIADMQLEIDKLNRKALEEANNGIN